MKTNHYQINKTLSNIRNSNFFIENGRNSCTIMIKYQKPELT